MNDGLESNEKHEDQSIQELRRMAFLYSRYGNTMKAAELSNLAQKIEERIAQSTVQDVSAFSENPDEKLN